MHEKVKQKYEELKKEMPDIDQQMIRTFLEEMPDEAMIAFDKMVYGCHIASEDLYHEAVMLFKWIDDKGTGAKWTVEDIVKLSGIDFNDKKYYEYDYAYVVNMLYSDYCNIFTEPTYYLKMARNYLEDVDYCGNADERAYHNAVKRIKYNEK